MSYTIQDKLRNLADNNSSEGQDRSAGSHCMREAADRIDTLLDKTRLQQAYMEGLPSTPDGGHFKPDHANLGEMTHDERLRGLEEAVSGLQENPPSEWLTLPWGGCVRKSEVVSAHVEPEGTLVFVNVRGGIVFSSGLHVFSLDKNVTASSWLADIERQLGIVR